MEDDGRVTGARHRHGHWIDTDKLAALIANRTRPNLAAKVEAVSVGDKTVLVLLADTFKWAGIVERTACGIVTIFYEQLRNGRLAPSYARSNEANVSVNITSAVNLDFVRLLVTEAQQERDQWLGGHGRMLHQLLAPDIDHGGVQPKLLGELCHRLVALQGRRGYPHLVLRLLFQKPRVSPPVQLWGATSGSPPSAVIGSVPALVR